MKKLTKYFLRISFILCTKLSLTLNQNDTLCKHLDRKSILFRKWIVVTIFYIRI